jgi:hypothetical protein
MDPMTTDEPAVRDPEPEAGDAPAEDAPAEDKHSEDEHSEDRQPSWWHRDHPTFSALTGFFTGLLFVALIPAVYVAVLSLIFDNDKVENLFPFVLVTLVVPLALVVNQRTRRFGTYFWIGIVLTAVVVVGVGALVLWYLVEHQK